MTFLTHFDQYEAGTGDLQESGEIGDLAIWLGVGNDSVTLSLSSGLMVEVSALSDAAIALTEATLEAKERYLARIRR